MNQPNDIERLLDRWLADGPSEAHDRVLETIADRIERQPQRPAWRLLWREIHVNGYLKPLAAVAAVLVIAIVGFSLIGGAGGSSAGGPAASRSLSAASASPSPSPTPSPSIACEDDLAGCAGLLAAGSHGSSNFQPAVTFRTPQGWSNVVDVGSVFKLDFGTLSVPYILMWSNAKIPNTLDSCEPGATSPDRTVQQWIDFISTHPRLDATRPVPVTIGGSKGQAIDITIRAGQGVTCPGLPAPVVQFIIDEDATGNYVYGATATDRMHLVLLDVGGRTVIIQVYGSTDQTTYEAGMAVVQPIIDSMRFAPTN